MMKMFKFRSSIRRFVAYGLTFALILGIGFTNVMAYADNAANDQDVAFSDVEGHWAVEQIFDWGERVLVAGYADGTFGPERGVTRAEFITFVNRAYGLKEKASAAFVDVSSADWFVDEVAKAVAAEYISGYDDGTMRPNAEISRLEAAVILYRLLRLESYKSESWIEGFNDSDAIADWGRVYVNSAVAEGYFSGYPDGTFKPGRVITRAETVSLLSKAVGTLYNVSGVYGPAEHNKRIEGNVTVSVSDVTLKGLTIEGDLFLTAGISDGDFEADGVVVKGRTIIGGGGRESIVFNNSTLGDVIVYVVDGKVRVVAKGDTSIDDVILESGGFLQEENLTGEGFGNVQILVLKPGQEVELDGDFDSVDIEASVEMSVTGNTRIKELNVSEDADGTEINLGKDTVIDTLTLDGGTDVTGKGTIKAANVNTDDYSFEKDPDKTVVESEKPEEDKKEEEEKEKDKRREPSKKSVTGIEVEPFLLVRADEKEPIDVRTIKATVIPANASNKRLTWSSDNEEVATVDENGVVTGKKGGTVTITVTSVADSSIKATVHVVVGDILVPAGGEIQEAINQAEGEDWVVVAPSKDIYAGFAINENNITVKAVGNVVISTVPQEGTIGGGGDVGILIDGAEGVTIEGFTMEDDSCKEKSMGVTVFKSGSVTVSGCTFENLTRGIYANSNADYGDYPITITARGNIFKTGVGIGGTENTTLTATGNIFETTAEGIGLGPGVKTPDDVTGDLIEYLFSTAAGNTFNTGSGDAVVDWRDGKIAYNDNGVFVQFVQKQGTEVFYNTIKAAVDVASPGDTILVGPGEYDVTYLEGETFKHYLWIDKGVTIKAADMDHKPVLKAKYKDGYGKGSHQQATVHITADNVTLEGLVIHDIENYGGWLKVVEITDANNATIQNCEIKSETNVDTSIYLAGLAIGKYTITNNLLDGGIVPANGAGNASGGSGSSITDNIIGGSISFTGKTNSGWDPNSFETYPTIEGNTINGLSGMLINSRDEDSSKLISDEIMLSIKINNTFPEGIVGVVQDSYEAYNATLHRKRLMLNPAVYNETSGKGYDTLEAAVAGAKNDDTIVLGQDITLTNRLVLNKPLILDGNGKTISGEYTSNQAVFSPQADNITIKNVTMKGEENVILINTMGTPKNLTIDNVIFDGSEGVKYGFYAVEGFENFKIINSEFKNLKKGIGLELGSGAEPFTIYYNKFENISGNYLEGIRSDDIFDEIRTYNTFDVEVELEGINVKQKAEES